jgi:response regulator RpfG family c-di-GMP phosphodiesterase
MNLDAAFGRPPLVLLVDPTASSRHWMWRALNSAFGVLEAGSARGAREWMDRRSDIDALIVENELPDAPGVDLVGDLASARHPIASRSIVLARPSPDWARVVHAQGATFIERGDLRAVITKLAGWFMARDARVVRTLMREAERLTGG